jgi:hypothetical protein
MEVSPQLDSFRGFGLFFRTGLMYMHTQQTGSSSSSSTCYSKHKNKKSQQRRRLGESLAETLESKISSDY